MAPNPRRLRDPFEGDQRPDPKDLVDRPETNNFEEVKVTFEAPPEPPADSQITYSDITWEFDQTPGSDAVDAALTDMTPQSDGWITLDSVQFADAPDVELPDDGFGLDG